VNFFNDEKRPIFTIYYFYFYSKSLRIFDGLFFFQELDYVYDLFFNGFDTCFY